jgi:hypothetical protein
VNLGIAVVRGLDDLRVHTHRRVVDKDPSIDLGKIDLRINAVLVRVQGSNDIVAVKAKIQREVVAGPRRDDNERDPVTTRHRGDRRLRAVTTRHAEQVGASGHCVLGQLAQVVAPIQDDRLDAPQPTQID